MYVRVCTVQDVIEVIRSSACDTFIAQSVRKVSGNILSIFGGEKFIKKNIYIKSDVTWINHPYDYPTEPSQYVAKRNSED